MIDYESYIETIDDYIVNRTKTVVIAFFVVTLVFSAGLGNISTEAGTSQFTEDSPAADALDSVDREFSQPFDDGGGSTQLIQRGQNVLAKEAMLDMLRVQYRAQQREGLRVTSTSSFASIVARTLDPSATTLEAQIDAMEGATRTEVRTAARQVLSTQSAQSLVSDDVNRESVTASATIGVVSHDVPGAGSSGAGTGGTSPLTGIQEQIQYITTTVGSDIEVFGSGLISAELSSVILDSLLIVVPAAVVLILVFLVISYRDPFDLLLGVVSLLIAIIWTFGFMGLAGIAFSQMLIAVPPLLLAVGIDFGIHAINRYREERVEGRDISTSMRITTDQLLVAFTIVTVTTVLGFLSNTISDLAPIRDFGLVAAVGILFTFFIFGIFLPAAKVMMDRFRERVGLPRFGSNPLGSEDSVLSTVLGVGVTVSRYAPRLFLVVVLVSTASVGAYGTGVDTTFSQEDFLPPAEQPQWLQELPEPFAPGTYTVTRNLDFLEENFESSQGSSVIIYVEGDLRRGSTLESIQQASQSPPDVFVTDDRYAESSSIVTVIRDYADQSPEFAALVDRNDIDDDGIPDQNLERIYDELFASPYADQADDYLTDDYRSAQVVYTAEAGASQDAVVSGGETMAERFRQSSTATGQTFVLVAVTNTIFSSAIESLALALAATAVFLVIAYKITNDSWSLGLANLVPIVVAVAFIAGTMRYLGIPLNALTATILSIAIGLGIDYSAHVVHRFADEYEESGGDVTFALRRTINGTGGALTGSMLTTTSGMGVLALAITPILGQFGIVVALSIGYSYVAAMVVSPSVLVVWDQVVG
ncbi:efflux RND transporter permease subunit [Candidatus Halobonum tyrrellensis]|uniref:SSD domain-containing protein n=1 Tax=Candidatus Halobonum tyrrellensis G22 TaxID=1324957 RepID=V4HGV6_9EURY|nr:MMPL family transporter [Candidatus Halobonum tyrrellensis]ESP89940.1 hypothetical protein K933_00217 [Candidatus Halobonum tyrrellensis G22]